MRNVDRVPRPVIRSSDYWDFEPGVPVSPAPGDRRAFRQHGLPQPRCLGDARTTAGETPALHFPKKGFEARKCLCASRRVGRFVLVGSSPARMKPWPAHRR